MKKSKKKKLRLKRFHISFQKRICFCITFFIISLLFGITFIVYSLNVERNEEFYFKEYGDVSYTVCLFKNDFFDNDCLNSNMSYVASLIKNIPLNFSYQFDSNKFDVINNIEYEIKANLVISNSDTLTKYYEKEYVLVNRTSEDVFNAKTFKISKDIDIDYKYYNEIANKFKSEFGVNSDSYLEVYMTVYNNVNSDYSVNNLGKISVNIPLSLKAIEIKLDTQGINKIQNDVITTKYFTINNLIRFVCGVLLLVFSIYYFISIILLLLPFRNKKNKYDILLKKYMKEYDRLIVDTSTLPKFSMYNILKVKSFEELLDVRDNLRLPIMFFEIKKHEKAHFYILHNNNLYLFTLKAVDLL